MRFPKKGAVFRNWQGAITASAQERLRSPTVKGVREEMS